MNQFKYFLAPLENFTGPALRSICHKYGADLTFTELARVDSLARNNKSTLSRIELNDDFPVIIQLLGSNEDSFKRFLSKFEPLKGFKGFNLNLGCPSLDVIRIGQGSALIRRITKTRKPIEIFRDYSYPISIKMRLGINAMDKKNKVYLNLINKVSPDFFIVHARHAMQTYANPADFSIYEECVKTGKKIIANGNIDSTDKTSFLRQIGVMGVMLGRHAVVNPGIFNLLKGIDIPNIEQMRNEYIEMADRMNEPSRYRKNVLKHIGNDYQKI